MLRDFLEPRCKLTICFIGELTVAEWLEAEAVLKTSIIGPGAPGSIARVVHKCFPQSHPAQFGVGEATLSTVELGHFHSNEIADFVCHQVNSTCPDIVLLEYVTLSYLATAIKKLNHPPTVVIDTHDVMHIRNRAFAELGMTHWLDIDRDSEWSALSQADVVLAIQESDKKTFESGLSDNVRICLAKHSGDYRGNNRTTAEDESFRIGFLGSQGIANQKSLGCFLEESWESLRKDLGERIVLKVAGGLTREEIHSQSSKLNGLTLLGSVENLSDFFDSVDCTINPAIIPSGFKIKTLDSIRYGTPVVATPSGMAGIEVANQLCAVTANRGVDFSNAIHELVDDRARHEVLADNCKAFVAEHFTPNVVFAEFWQMIQTSVGRAS